MSRNTQRDAQTHIKRLNSEKLIFPVNIFRTPDKLFNSVKNAESHDVKNWPVFAALQAAGAGGIGVAANIVIGAAGSYFGSFFDEEDEKKNNKK